LKITECINANSILSEFSLKIGAWHRLELKEEGYPDFNMISFMDVDLNKSMSNVFQNCSNYTGCILILFDQSNVIDEPTLSILRKITSASSEIIFDYAQPLIASVEKGDVDDFATLIFLLLAHCAHAYFLCLDGVNKGHMMLLADGTLGGGQA
jgi:hypothetical protein